MKITQERLAQIIKEEVDAYKGIVKEQDIRQRQIYLFKKAGSGKREDLLQYASEFPESAQQLLGDFRKKNLKPGTAKYAFAKALSGASRGIRESLDLDIIDELEALVTPQLANAVMKAHEQMTTPTDVDQVYANTGEPVSKDPKVMHDKAVEIIGEIIFDQSKKIKKDRVDEDGHSDVPSAIRAMKTIIEDAGQMLQALEQMDGSLPTWWTNKMAVSASMLNKMRDYLLVSSMEEEVDEQ
tara:strand:- start:1461 stop:2180 length:720 start_codon:yes stop_codon:yes gene_type:complete